MSQCVKSPFFNAQNWLTRNLVIFLGSYLRSFILGGERLLDIIASRIILRQKLQWRVENAMHMKFNQG